MKKIIILKFIFLLVNVENKSFSLVYKFKIVRKIYNKIINKSVQSSSNRGGICFLCVSGKKNRFN